MKRSPISLERLVERAEQVIQLHALGVRRLSPLQWQGMQITVNLVLQKDPSPNQRGVSPRAKTQQRAFSILSQAYA